jgi:hypothetical protein
MARDPKNIDKGRRNFLTSALGITAALAASPGQALARPDRVMQRTIETLKRAEFLHLTPQRTTGSSPALNETGAFLFSRMDGRTAIETMARDLTDHFDTDFETAVNDLRKLVRDLEVLGFITV